MVTFASQCIAGATAELLRQMTLQHAYVGIDPTLRLLGMTVPGGGGLYSAESGSVE